MITCPYCQERFDDVYYHLWHVPCPSPAGDKPDNKPKEAVMR